MNLKESFLYSLLYVFWKPLSFFFFPVKVVGRQNIPRTATFILASNHLSNLDPLLLGFAIRRVPSYMAKEELFRHKLFGALIRIYQTFPVKRGRADIGAMREAFKRIKKGEIVALFPTGTREGATGGAENFQETPQVESGLGFLVAKSGCSVLPVRIIGSDKVLPRGAKWPTRSLITVIIGAPLFFSNEEDYSVISKKVMQTIWDLN
ncbi:MAG: 1-acyl-sn-glycerol-3-phosphate acyltransferase [Candidatus Omnitrophica bacterium]|nr:1-acyl-sn-glycerol-3-phosphate acyltransferase [Candidatus Omnitrophota bacterium]